MRKALCFNRELRGLVIKQFAFMLRDAKTGRRKKLMLLWRKGGQEQTGEIDVKRPYVAAVVVAAGTSSRMQA